MASPTHTAQVLVLRKTKLKESDLIIDFLAEDGSALRAVAKGARKPTSPFASRLELYSCCDVLFARGRSLDIVKEARITTSNAEVRGSLERAACAAVVAELVDRVAQPDLPVDKLFPMTNEALRVLGCADVPAGPLIAAAHNLKAFALCGVRPELSCCVGCGAAPPLNDDRCRVAFSCEAGGVVCDACRIRVESVAVDTATVKLARAVLASTFHTIATWEVNAETTMALLELCRSWARHHLGIAVKSYGFLLTSGLF